MFALRFPGYRATLIQLDSKQAIVSWNANDSLTMTTGKHSVKLGVDFREIRSQLFRASPIVNNYFNSSSAVLTNTSYSSASNVGVNSYPAYLNAAVYAQDDFRISPRLDVSIGLRWEVNPSPFQTQGTLPYIAQGSLADPASLTLAPAGTRFYRTTYGNLAPRLGVAYQANDRPNAPTIVRAGAGVFFDSGQQSSTQPFGESPGQSAYQAYSNVSYPLTPTEVNLPLVNPPVAPYSGAYLFRLTSNCLIRYSGMSLSSRGWEKIRLPR